MERNRNRGKGAFTLVELLVVIAVIGILALISMPAYAKIREKAFASTHLSNLRNLTVATLHWTADNGQFLPSPQYPGGHKEGDSAIPEKWDFAGTGSGLWLDGVVFYAAYYAAKDENEVPEKVDGENGNHLKGTFLASMQSFKKNPLEEDWHKHSYAMNKSIQYDHLYAGSSDPELTNKNLAKLTHRSKTLLFIENEESNVIGYGDQEMILATAEKRWSSGKALASFLDGSTRALGATDFPSASRAQDNETSHFWSGVDADAFCGS